MEAPAFIPGVVQPVHSLGLPLSPSPSPHSILAQAAPRGSLALGASTQLRTLAFGGTWPPRARAWSGRGAALAGW